MLWTFVILGVIMLAGPVILVILNGRTHSQQRQFASYQGWTYLPAGPLAGLRQTFLINGQAANGLTWTLSHDPSRQFVIWRSTAKLLPYGRLMVMPRFSQDTDLLLKEHQLRPVPFGGPAWRERYTLLNTHDHLSDKYISEETEITLLNWPDRDTPGGLLILSWDTEQLEIKARFHRDWTTYDRLISLGNGLLLHQTNGSSL